MSTNDKTLAMIAEATQLLDQRNYADAIKSV